MTISILHLTDLHFCNSELLQLDELKNKIIKNIEENKQKVDFLLFSGDLAKKPAFNTFQDAYNLFLKPILESVDLDISSCFFTTGNHDINITKRDNLIFAGLESMQGDSKTITSLINGDRELEEIKDYKVFIDKNSSPSTLITNNQLYTTYRKNIDGVEIGIVSINSSLYMKGSKLDYGSLYIAENLILQATNDIKDTTIKILNLHHSLDWYKNKKELERTILDKFNLVFFGHEHEHDGKFILDLQNRDILSLNGTSLFDKKNTLNGYSLYQYDIDKLEMHINNSQYDFKKKSFNNINVTTLTDIDLTNKANKLIRNQSICSTMYTPIKDVINKYLTINLTSEVNQKNIEDIYVNQKIVDSDDKVKNKNNGKEEDKTLYLLDELIAMEGNILLTGKQESGKTTNLNMLNLKYLSSHYDYIPIFLNSAELMHTTTEREFISKVGDFLDKYYGKNNFKIKTMLQESRFVFLIDDIDLLKNEFVNEILKYNNKVIATFTNDRNVNLENILEKFNNESDLFNKFKKLDLKALRKKDCKHLVQNIVPAALTTKISNKVQKSLTKLKLPANPLITTLLIWMHLEKIDIRENEPEIIDLFLDYLLEKTDLSKQFKGKIDFKDKKDLLAVIAYEFFKEKSFSIKQNKILKAIIDHFEYSGSDVDADAVLNYFYKRKILLKNNGNVIFSYRVFYYYFMSLFIINNEKFKLHIMQDKNLIINMIDELRYYAAMSRNDIKFIDAIMIFLETSRFHKKTEKQKVEFLAIPEIIENTDSKSDNEETNLDITHKCDIQLSSQEQKLGDEIDDRLTQTRDDSVNKYNYKTTANEDLLDLKEYREEFFVLTLIGSEFLKHFNSSISFDNKNFYMNKLLKNYSLALDYWNTVLSNDHLILMLTGKKLKQENISKEELYSFRDFLKGTISMSIAETAVSSLTTAKLTKSYKENILDEKELNKHLFYTLLISEVDEDTFLQYVNDFIDNNNDNISLFEILFAKLSYSYIHGNYNSQTKQEVYNLLLRLSIVTNVGKENLKTKKLMQRYLPDAKKQVDNILKVRQLLL